MVLIFLICVIIAAVAIYEGYLNKKYNDLEKRVFTDLCISGWNSIPFVDIFVTVKSRQALEKYDELKFFKENEDALNRADYIFKMKDANAKRIHEFINSNPYKNDSEYKAVYKKIEPHLYDLRKNAAAFRIGVNYITSAGNNLDSKVIALTYNDIAKYFSDPTLLMNKSELNKYMKEKAKTSWIPNIMITIIESMVL